MQQRRWAAASLAMVVAVSTGCSAGPDQAPQSAAAPVSSGPARPRFDPPTRFGPTVTALGEGLAFDVLLHEGTAFAAADTGVAVTDVLSGQRLATLSPSMPVLVQPVGLGGRSGRTPVLVQRDGRPAVVIPYAVKVPSPGTAAASRAVQLLVADAVTGAQLAALPVSVVPEEGEGDVTVIGAHGNTLVLVVGRDVTVGVDLSTGSVLWREPGFAAAALLGDSVVGLTARDTSLLRKVAGLSVTDGARRWSTDSVGSAALAAAGPAYVVLLAEQDDGERFYARIDGAGTFADREAGAYGVGLDCRYDQAAITVCWTGHELVFALDATSGALLWQLPAAGRTAPTVTAVWHGAVYGTASGSAVVLDARTGVDRGVSPGLAPVAVSGYAGVAVDPATRETLNAYPAVG